AAVAEQMADARPCGPAGDGGPDAGPGEHDGAVAQPRAGAHDHRPLGHDLARDREPEGPVTVFLVGDVDVVAGPDVVPDLDREVPDDAAPLADQAAVADPHHPVGQAA